MQTQIRVNGEFLREYPAILLVLMSISLQANAKATSEQTEDIYTRAVQGRSYGADEQALAQEHLGLLRAVTREGVPVELVEVDEFGDALAREDELEAVLARS